MFFILSGGKFDEKYRLKVDFSEFNVISKMKQLEMKFFMYQV